MNPLQIFMSQLFGQNNNFQNFNQPMMNPGGNNWKTGYSISNNFQNQNNPGNNMENKMNCIFKTSNGKSFNILFDADKTGEELIQTFFKRVDREDLFNSGGVFFLYNAAKIDYHSKELVQNIFKYNSRPCIMVMDVNNLIGA